MPLLYMKNKNKKNGQTLIRKRKYNFKAEQKKPLKRKGKDQVP